MPVVPPHIGGLVWTCRVRIALAGTLLGVEPGGTNVPAPPRFPRELQKLRGLPANFIGVGSIDLLIDEDIEYARRLINAGVATELLIVPGAVPWLRHVRTRYESGETLYRLPRWHAFRKAFQDATA